MNIQSQREFPNIYGRKKSRLTLMDGSTINTFDSRRQARKARAKECELLGLKTYQTRIVVMEQLSDTKRSTEDGKEKIDGKQRDSEAKPANSKKSKVQGNKRRASGGSKPANRRRDSGPGSGSDSTESRS